MCLQLHTTMTMRLVEVAVAPLGRVGPMMPMQVKEGVAPAGPVKGG